MNDWNIIGHDWAVRRLRQQMEGSQLAQSHLFIGPPSVGKATLARALAGAVLSRDAVDPIRARRLVEQLKHPDLTWVASEEGSIKVEQVREMLHVLTLAPVEGAHRLAVLDDAHLATDSSMNAILKTLEEPNPSSIIILISPTTDGVLPTITSRCQVLNLRPVATDTLKADLVARGADPERANLLARLARGRPGWAIRALDDNEVLSERAQRLGDLETLLSANRTRRFAYAEALAKAGEETVRDVLGEWLMFWRDIARASDPMAAQDGIIRDRLRNVDHAESILRLAAALDTRQAARMVRDVANTIKVIEQNASARLAIDVLMLRMPVV